MILNCMMRCAGRSLEAMFAEPAESRILMKMNYIDAVETDKRVMTHSHALKGGAFNHKFMLNCAKYAFTITTSVVWWCYSHLSLFQHGRSEI